MNYTSCLEQYTSSVQTWPSAWQIAQRFSRMRGKDIKGGENHHISGLVESCSYLKGELVGSVSQRRENVLTSK